MARSLGLTAYRALARRAVAQTQHIFAPRPKGELLWIHAAEPGNVIAIQDLALRLCTARIGLNILITLPEGDAPTPPLPSRQDIGRIDQITAPSEHPQAVAAFLDHWKPDACIWAWGALRPNLILEAAARHCPLVLVDADTRGFDGRRDRWLPDLTRHLLALFSAVLARSDTARKRLVQLGRLRDTIDLTSPLLAGGQALPYVETDLSDLSMAMGGRPVWFAANVLPKEVPVVLSAHRKAMRLSHRLLLILHPASAPDGDAVEKLATSRDFNVLRWGDGGVPDETTQVMVADDAADLGLFFRIAPVSFLGSSLIAGEGGCDPFDAAALGSAVLYGPKVRHFMHSYTRLAAAGAARIVNDADALGTAVSRLIAPDQAAAMAHAGWDVISQGAAVTDQVTDLIQDILDTSEAGK
ncbi:MAG: 3-deoxy-D-manno-octulosonic-acid transferase [Sulfitobacter sp.]|jgi:3-deoxy-D-manno-octulosonic-acid transferase